ncbi:MAG: hypothetical protein NXI14_09755, partial [bacterium]|nr:hypothetical protein [bacterium]
CASPRRARRKGVNDWLAKRDIVGVERMSGSAIAMPEPEEHATAALLEELVDFCPSSRDRANLGRVLKATREVMDKARDVVERRIDELIDGGALERAVLEAVPPTVEAAAGGSSGSAPASSASIQPP